MNPFVLFDYLFFSIIHWYNKTFNPIEISEFRGVAIVSIFQYMNVVSLLNFFFAIGKNKILSIVLLLIIFALNYIRYKKYVRYSSLELKWFELEKKTRIKRNKWIIFYFVFTIIFFLISNFVNIRI
jgi:hypothetical protein